MTEPGREVNSDSGPENRTPAFDHTSMRSRPVPPPLVALGAAASNLEWHNELGGLTFNLGDRFLKWNPRHTGIDLRREWNRLAWLSPRHPAPRPLSWDEDDDAQWMVTRALPGGAAVRDQWRARPREAIAAIAKGLRAIHDLATDDVPPEWINEVWCAHHPSGLPPRPPVDEPVLVHGDACAPNTLIDDSGTWVGHVDLGDLTVADRWADLAIASMSLDWNFGPDHQGEFYRCYGIEPDHRRIDYYRRLWHLES